MCPRKDLWESAFNDEDSKVERTGAQCSAPITRATTVRRQACVALDVDVLGKRCIHLILDPDAALDLALRITGAVVRQRRAATL